MNDKRPPHIPRGIYAFAGDGLGAELSIEAQIDTLLAAGLKCIQIRLKATPDAEALALTSWAVRECKARGAVCIVNDRADMALLSGAEGLHLGEEDMPVAAARRLLGKGVLIGRTVRNLEQAQEAKEAGADYVGLGPVFETRTKAVKVAPLGLEVLSAVAERSPLPLVAIGGIDASNIEPVARAGAHAAAVISGIWKALEPGQQALALRQLFEKALSL